VGTRAGAGGSKQALNRIKIDVRQSLFVLDYLPNSIILDYTHDSDQIAKLHAEIMEIVAQQEEMKRKDTDAERIAREQKNQEELDQAFVDLSIMFKEKGIV
jgi:hypothetical protein